MPAPLQVEKLVLQKLERALLAQRAQRALQTSKWRHQCEHQCCGSR
jgi:hypothetical protein